MIRLPPISTRTATLFPYTTLLRSLRTRAIAFRSLTEAMDTDTPHGELLFSLFGALAQYERALTRERVIAGLAAAKRRGRRGGRPPTLNAEQIEQITAALDAGASKADRKSTRLNSSH